MSFGICKPPLRKRASAQSKRFKALGGVATVKMTAVRARRKFRYVSSFSIGDGRRGTFHLRGILEKPPGLKILFDSIKKC
jgi:hypothetical protein